MDFKDALTTKIGDMERPPVLPIGLYLCAVSKVPELGTAGQDKYDTVDFTLAIKQPIEVDKDDLKDYGGNVVGQTIRHRFMFNKEDEVNFARSLFNIRRFLEEHLKCATTKTELKKALNDSVNHSCYVQVRHRPDPTDAEITYTDVARTLPVE